MDVATNVGREFLKLIDLHFPPGHILHPVINRSTVKVSYRALPNIGAQISKHNQKVLRQSQGGAAKPPPSCNCQKRFKKDCPIPGACNQDGVVYQATVTNNKGEWENHVGLAKNFKKRYRKHKDSLEKVNPNNSTTLSTYVGLAKNFKKRASYTSQFLQPIAHQPNPLKPPNPPNTPNPTRPN